MYENACASPFGAGSIQQAIGSNLASRKESPAESEILELEKQQAETRRLLADLTARLKLVLCAEMPREDAGARPCLATALLEMIQCRKDEQANINEALRLLADRVVL